MAQEKIVQTAGRTQLGEFAPKFAELNDDVLFGEVWSREEIYGVIVDCAWRTGEPGPIFIDAINRAIPPPHLGERLVGKGARKRGATHCAPPPHFR